MEQNDITSEHAVDNECIFMWGYFTFIWGYFTEAKAHKRLWSTLRRQCSLVLTVCKQGANVCISES